MKTKKEYRTLWETAKVKIIKKQYVDGLLFTAHLNINNQKVTLEQDGDYSPVIEENTTNFSNNKYEKTNHVSYTN
jgi:hypothetical protein